MILSHQLLSQLCKLSLPRPVMQAQGRRFKGLLDHYSRYSVLFFYNFFHLLTTLLKKEKNRLPDRLFS